MTTLNGTTNARSMNGLTDVNANNINCDTINTIDATITNDLSVGDNITTNSLNVASNTTTGSLNVVNTADVSGNLNITGITDATRLQADNLILGTATYNAAVQLKMNGVMNIGDQVNLNSQSRVLNIRDTNGLISIGRYSGSEPGFELRNYNPTGGALRTDVLFLGGGATEVIRCTFRSPGLGGDFVAWFGYRTQFDFQTPTQNNPSVQLTGTQYTARFRDKFTTPVGMIDIVLNPTAGNFSSIIQAGDKTIVSQNGLPLALCCTNSIGGGIRLTATGNEIGGNTDLSGNLTITGTLSIPSYPDVKATLDGLNSNALTGITYDAGTDTTTIDNNVSITKTLSIPSYANVKTTLDTINTAITGITYDSVNDDTVIQNNVVLGNNKNIYQDGTGAIIQSATGGTNILNTVSLGFGAEIIYDDDTEQRSKYTEETLRETDILSFMSGRTILLSTYNISNATNHSLVGVSTGIHYFLAIRVIKGYTYSGVGIYTGTAGNWNCALYESGLQPARRAISSSTASTANSMTYMNFQIPYAVGNTRIMYVAIRTTTSSPAQTQLYLPSNTFLNYGNNAMTASTLNKKTQFCSNASDFPLTIPSGLTMSLQAFYGYVVLY